MTGDRISSLRKSKGLSQELLAENSGISLRTIQRIEAGTSAPRPFTLKLIADALGVSVEALYPTPTEHPATDQTAPLKLINLSGLTVLVLPVLNIIVPAVLWRIYRRQISTPAVAAKIITFQILWTIATAVTLVVYQLAQISVTGSAYIGRLPIIAALYYLLVSVNAALTLRAARRLQAGKTDVYEFIPLLF